jgi:ABC-type multidrug transport system permease subunit
VTPRRIALLLGKDLRVLGRSPLLLIALIAYPLAIAALVALVASFASDKPRVAFVDEDGLPETIVIGGQEFDVQEVLDQVEAEVDLIPLDREEADERLESGDVVAQIIVPPGFASRLRGMTRSPTLILRTAQGGGLSGRVERQTEALVFNLNRRLQDSYIQANLDYVELLQEGGTGTFLGNQFDVLGLDRAAEILDEILARPQPPEIEADAEELRDFIDEAQLALDQTGASLRATANPIELRAEDAERRERLLSTQLQAYALALTLAIVCILLAAAGIAVERDENVVGRLARGLVRLGELVAAKVGLALVAGTVFGLGLAVVFAGALELAGEGAQPWERLPLLAIGLALAGAAFGAFGVLLGVLAREARTASLVALLVAVPIVLLGFLPEASVAPAAWISEVFPFSHAVAFLQSALYDIDPWGTLGAEAGWLVGLLGIFAAAARLCVRRLTS